MNDSYPKLRRSFEKSLTRKTTKHERLFIKWLSKQSNKDDKRNRNEEVYH
ncbi:hypothetical protein [Halalkalibacter krulwichiae]|nr:hypothetical protein [Halalkalibacter krulwichiae]